MSAWLKAAAVLVLVAFVAVTLTIVTPAPARSAPGPAPVFVVNTAGQPVPVAAQGTTAVAGTVAATQSGTWTVTVGATTPLPVTVQGNATAGELVMNSAAGSFNSSGESTVVLYTVPAGKRLIVDQVGINSYTASGTVLGSICREGYIHCLPVPLQNQGTFGSVTRFVGSDRVTYFVEAGEQFLGFCGRSLTTAGDYCSATFVGRLITAQ